MRLQRVGVAMAACVVALMVFAPAHAEDLKGRWYFGANLSYMSTTDSIRNNAAISIGPPGDDGIPFSFDPNEDSECGGVPQQPGPSPGRFCDRRPDDLLGRSNTVEETFRYEITAGFGLTSWLNLQLDAGYYSGDVGPVDAYLRDKFPIANNPVDPSSLQGRHVRTVSFPTSAGTLTEIPVSLTGIVRFRKDSPLNPYIGMGAGMIFADIDTSSDVDALNQRLSTMHIQTVANEISHEITPVQFTSLKLDGKVPFLWPIKVSVEDAHEWHLVGGAEYFLNDRFSVAFDARYTFADRYVDIDMNGEDQIDLQIYSEKLYRKDGSVKMFNSTGVAPNTLCADINYEGYGCDPVQRNPAEHVNPTQNGPLPGQTGRQCPNVGDYDHNGTIDQCYFENILDDPSGVTPAIFPGTRAEGNVVIQGGRISLTNFTIAVGLRVHW